MIEFSRKITPLDVLKDGARVGRITRVPKGRRFSLSLKGHLFWDGEFRKHEQGKGGYHTQHYKRLTDAKAIALETISR